MRNSDDLAPQHGSSFRKTELSHVAFTRLMEGPRRSRTAHSQAGHERHLRQSRACCHVRTGSRKYFPNAYSLHHSDGSASQLESGHEDWYC